MAAILTRDKAGVVNVWEMHKCPCFGVLEGAKLIFTCIEENEEDRRAELEKYLDIIKSSLSYAPFTIQFYDRADFKRAINTSTPYTGGITFKLNEAGELATKSGVAAPNNFNMELMNQVFQGRLDLIDQKYQAQMRELERKHEEELRELEEEDAEDDGLGAIGLIGKAGEKYPWMQQSINDLMNIGQGLLKSLTGSFGGNAQHNAIAGAPDGATNQEKLNWAIKSLIETYSKKYGSPDAGDTNLANDMERLAKLAEGNPGMFDFVLNSLRGMK